MSMQGEQVLVVDPSESRRTELVGLLNAAGVTTKETATCEAALALLAIAPVPVIFADVELPDKSGYYLLRQVKELYPECEVVLLAQNATDYNLLQALRQGAFDFIMRPLDTGDILLPTLKRTARHLELKRRNEVIVRALEEKTRALERALDTMRALNTSIERLTALTDVRELLRGLLDAALTVLGARCGFIALIERESGRIGIRISQGYVADLRQSSAALVTQGLISEVARRGEPLLVADELPKDLAALRSATEQAQLLPYPGILSVPLVLHNREAGLVVLCGHPGGHPFTADDLTFLEHLAHHTELVLEHVGMLLRLQQGK